MALARLVALEDWWDAEVERRSTPSKLPEGLAGVAWTEP